MKKRFPIVFFKRSNVIFDFGVTILSNVLVGGLIGYYLDKWTFNNKVLLVVFLFIGIVSGMYNGMRMLFKEAKKEDEDDKSKGN